MDVDMSTSSLRPDELISDEDDVGNRPSQV